MSDSISTKILMWLLGIIGALLLTATSATLKFYYDWATDEAAEDAAKDSEKAVMFDNPEQKVEIIKHPREVPSALEQRLKIDHDLKFQETLLKELREMDSLRKLDADQIFQTKEQIRKINDHIESDH